jgi:myo-inositol-1(or 4)-monophosphatase
VWSDGVVQREDDLDLISLERLATGLATETAKLVRGFRARGDFGVDTKSTPTDLVTQADRAAERLIREQLAELRPVDAVLGEEEGGGEPGEGVTWVIDPIDGTVNFVHGFPWYGVSIAVQVNGESVVGVIAEPVSGRLWTARRGAGSRCDGVPLRVSGATDLTRSLVATGFTYRRDRRIRQAAFAERLLGRVGDIRRPGAASLDLCAVAAGWVDGYLEHGLHRWDWAAGALVAAEAGAVVRLPETPERLSPGATFAAAPGIADELATAALECGIADVWD